MRLQFAETASDACCDLSSFRDADGMSATIYCGHKQAEIIDLFSRKSLCNNWPCRWRKADCGEVRQQLFTKRVFAIKSVVATLVGKFALVRQLLGQNHLKSEPLFGVRISETVNCRCLDVREHGRPHLPQKANRAKQVKWLSDGGRTIPLSDLRDERMRKVGRNCDRAVFFEVPTNVIDQQQQTAKANPRAPSILSLNAQ